MATLESADMKKPATPPKPTGIVKKINIPNQSHGDTDRKIKPPLLPKPKLNNLNVKPKVNTRPIETDTHRNSNSDEISPKNTIHRIVEEEHSNNETVTNGNNGNIRKVRNFNVKNVKLFENKKETSINVLKINELVSKFNEEIEQQSNNDAKSSLERINTKIANINLKPVNPNDSESVISLSERLDIRNNPFSEEISINKQLVIDDCSDCEDHWSENRTECEINGVRCKNISLEGRSKRYTFEEKVNVAQKIEPENQNTQLLNSTCYSMTHREEAKVSFLHVSKSPISLSENDSSSSVSNLTDPQHCNLISDEKTTVENISSTIISHDNKGHDNLISLRTPETDEFPLKPYLVKTAFSKLVSDSIIPVSNDFSSKTEDAEPSADNKEGYYSQVINTTDNKPENIQILENRLEEMYEKYDRVYEEPIYYEIDDIMCQPRFERSDQQNKGSSVCHSSQDQADGADTQSDQYESVEVVAGYETADIANKRDASDGSDCSSIGSFSDLENQQSLFPNPNASALEDLVRNTINIVRGSISPETPRKRIHTKSTETQNATLNRTSSGRSTNSRHEDVHSICSNGTDELSFTLRKKLSGFWSSFGKGNSKRPNSLFYSSEFDQDTDMFMALPEPQDIHGDDHATSPDNTDIQDNKPLTPEELADKKKRMAFRVADEIRNTEKVYFNGLSLLCDTMIKECQSDIPMQDLQHIIQNLPPLKDLHAIFLKAFEDRLNNWETSPIIADIFVKNGYFLKLYASYTQTFEAQCKFLDECTKKYPIFSKKLKQFEAKHCANLLVRDYMLTPVQRLTRYRLLLKEYLSQLEPDTPDYENSEKALQIVCDVVEHTNNVMNQENNLTKLLKIQSKLGNYMVIKAGRSLIKEGELFKYSRKGQQLRYFILLSDCLLITSHNGTGGYRLNYEIPLEGMLVTSYPNEFTIESNVRSVILRGEPHSKNQEWVDALQTAIKTKQNLRPHCKKQEEVESAPVWVPDGRVSMCQLCMEKFTLFFRRHHCRACGKAVCGPCSSYQAPIKHDKFKFLRVCELCFKKLAEEFQSLEPAKLFDKVKAGLHTDDINEVQNKVIEIKSGFDKIKESNRTNHKYVPPRLIEVPPNDSDSQASGWLYRKYKKQWKRRWCVLKAAVLYEYKRCEDVAAHSTIPVLGYELKTSTSEELGLYGFKLIHKTGPELIFGVEDQAAYDRWTKAIEEATKLE